MKFASRGQYVLSGRHGEIDSYKTLAEAKIAAREIAKMPLRWKQETVGDITTYYSDGDYTLVLMRPS